MAEGTGAYEDPKYIDPTGAMKVTAAGLANIGKAGQKPEKEEKEDPDEETTTTTKNRYILGGQRKQRKDADLSINTEPKPNPANDRLKRNIDAWQSDEALIVDKT